MHYLAAHGYTAGPVQRPVEAGTLTGVLAALPALYILHVSGALGALSQLFHANTLESLGLLLAFFITAGALYGRIFQRAANDRRGGWLFGLSFGFLLWVLAPVVAIEWWISQKAFVGRAATGIFAANLMFGFVLGLLYPWLHLLIQRRLDDVIRLWHGRQIEAYHERMHDIDRDLPRPHTEL